MKKQLWRTFNMTLNDIIEAYNDAEREYAVELKGHYMIAKTVTPKSLGAY